MRRLFPSAKRICKQGVNPTMLTDPLHCRIELYWIKYGAYGAAPGPARAGLRPSGADPAQRAGLAQQRAIIEMRDFVCERSSRQAADTVDMVNAATQQNRLQARVKVPGGTSGTALPSSRATSARTRASKAITTLPIY